MCDYTFGGCGAYFPGYAYYAPPFRGFHKPQHHRKWATTPTRQGSLIPPLIPYPTHPIGGRKLG